MATVTRTFELSVEAAAELDRRVEVDQRDASDVVNEMLVSSVERGLHEADFTPEQWQELQQGLEDERAGRLVPHEQVEAMLAQYRAVS